MISVRRTLPMCVLQTSFQNKAMEDPDEQVGMAGSDSSRGWWMEPIEEELWNFGTSVAAKHVLAFAGFFVLLHTTVHTATGAYMRSSNFKARDKLTAPRDVLYILHGAFTFCGGIALTFLSSGEPFQQQERLFSYNAVHHLVSTVTAGFWVYNVLFVVPNAFMLGRRDVLIVHCRTAVLAGLTYFSWFYPCVLGIKLWGWWGVGELASVGEAVNRLAVLSRPGTTVIIATFFGALLLTLLRFWLFSFLLLWTYRWVNVSDLMELPDEHPVRELTNKYLTATCVGALGMACMAFAEFREVLNATKAWSEQYKRAHTRSRASEAKTEHSEDSSANQDGGDKNRGKRKHSKKSR